MDKLNSVQPLPAIHSAYAALSGAQSHDAPAQVMGFAMAFLIVCEGLQIDPRTLLGQAERVIADADVHYSSNVRAFRTYVNNELRGKL